MAISLPIVAFVAMFAAGLLLAVVACLFNARTRPLGLAVLGLLAIGVLFVVMSLRGRVVHSHAERAGAWDAAAAHEFDEHGRFDPQRVFDGRGEQREQVQQARAAAAEILQNQRMAARMGDAVVQTSPDGSTLETYPDGSTLETYPDGTQIRQRGYDGFRSVVRGGRDGATFSSVETATWAGMFVIGSPLLALLAAFVVLKVWKSGGAAKGLGLLAAGVGAVLLGGLVFSGSRREVVLPEPGAMMTAELSHAAERAHELESLRRQAAAVQAEVERAKQEVLHRVQAATREEPLEAMWTKLTAPKIDLDPLTAPATTAAQRELADAARVILSATAADPFTQGWLMHAAKAILRSSRGEGDGQRAAAVAVAMTPAAPAEVVATQPASGTAGGEAQGGTDGDEAKEPGDEDANLAEKPRPKWIDEPPTLVGTTQRIVVSTDPFVSVGECHVQLQEKLRSVVQDRVHKLASEAHGGGGVTTPRLETMGVGVDYILTELCPEDEYIETLDTSVGEMKRVHALVEFSGPQDQFLLDRWRDYARVERIEMVSALAASAIGLVGLAFGLLKVDTWTRGYYTKRLFLGVPAAIIAVLVLLT